MNENAIVVSDLKKRFGDVVALDGISFSVPTGTVFGLLGPNGAGKTTAIRILTTIIGSDEGPATGLDPASRSDLWEMIRDLVADGTTVLLTTQYLDEADRLASEIVVVDQGRIIAQGTPQELKAKLGDTVIEMGFENEETARRV